MYESALLLPPKTHLISSPSSLPSLPPVAPSPQVELDVDPTCYSAVVYTTIAGQIKAPFFQRTPYVTVKITPIAKTIFDAPGTVVCIALSAPCATLSELCMGPTCKYSIFNNPKDTAKCCPVNAIADPLSLAYANAG